MAQCRDESLSPNHAQLVRSILVMGCGGLGKASGRKPRILLYQLTEPPLKTKWAVAKRLSRTLSVCPCVEIEFTPAYISGEKEMSEISKYAIVQTGWICQRCGKFSTENSPTYKSRCSGRGNQNHIFFLGHKCIEKIPKSKLKKTLQALKESNG